ncbi:hypothetical protein K469DRAFT_600191, partial [Zopfia rhizophila CBS 207.26]
VVGIDGVAVHLWDIPKTKISHILKLSILQGMFLWLAMMCAKVSILLLYLRLSPYKYFRGITYGLLAIVIVYGFLGSFEFLFACQPIAKYWNHTIAHGSCFNQSVFWLSNAAANSATDIIMVFLPIFMLWNVRIPIRQKIGLMAIFMTGSFVSVTSIIRLYYQVKLKGAKDGSWKAFTTAVWSTAELHVGLICTSLPYARPFLRHHFPKLLGSSDHTNTLATRRTKRSSQAAPATLPLNDEDEIWLCRTGNGLNGGIPLSPFNSAPKLSKAESVSLHTVIREDKSVTPSVQAGKTTSQGDEDSQRAILVADGIEIISDINVKEESTRRHNRY